jgi:hypothetical protein
MYQWVKNKLSQFLGRNDILLRLDKMSQMDTVGQNVTVHFKRKMGTTQLTPGQNVTVEENVSVGQKATITEKWMLRCTRTEYTGCSVRNRM